MKKIPLCPDHKLPLVRQEIRHRGKVTYCWNCPGTVTTRQREILTANFITVNEDTPCFYHVHEEEGVDGTVDEGRDTGTTPNKDQN